MADDRMPEVANGLSGRCPRISKLIGMIQLGDVNQRVDVGMVVVAHRSNLRPVICPKRVAADQVTGSTISTKLGEVGGGSGPGSFAPASKVNGG